MTNKFSIGELKVIAETDHVQCGDASALAKALIELMGSEPVCFVSERNLATLTKYRAAVKVKAEPVMVRPVALYRHAQPMPVVSADLLHTAASAIEDLLTTKDRTGAGVWFDLPSRLRSAANAQPAPVVPEDVLDALQKVARIRLDLNGFDGDRRGIADCLGNAEEALIEVVNRRAVMLQAGNCRENANSSTNYFREITETSTSTAITPAAPDKKLTDDVLDEIIAGAKTSMEQYLALSLKAEREAWRQGEPTDDERIMAIEGIIPPISAGNSPVIPDGWTGNDKANAALMMLDRIETVDPVDDDRIDGIKRIIHELAAAPQEVSPWSSHYLPVTRGNDVECPFNRATYVDEDPNPVT